MDENKFKFFNYCTLLLIDADNHSKIFISKKISTTLNMVIIDHYA